MDFMAECAVIVSRRAVRRVGGESSGPHQLPRTTPGRAGRSSRATGPDGTEFSSDIAAEGYVNDQSQTFLEEINPGNQVKGTLAFDVPKGTRLSSIVLHESLFTSGVKVPLRER
jgi:uncharacterized protein DUF4352